MPIEDLFSSEENRKAVERTSDTLLDVWGEGIANGTHVMITERPRTGSGPLAELPDRAPRERADAVLTELSGWIGNTKGADRWRLYR